MKKIIIFGATGNVGAYVLKYARQYFSASFCESVPFPAAAGPSTVIIIILCNLSKLKILSIL